MLLIQPLKIDDMNIVIKDMDDSDYSHEQQQPQQAQPFMPFFPQPSPQQQQQYPLSLISPIDVIDDVELLAILGLPTSLSINATLTVFNSPVNKTLYNLPDLSDGKAEYNNAPQYATKKRKLDEDIFAQHDFEEPNLFTKKNVLHSPLLKKFRPYYAI